MNNQIERKRGKKIPYQGPRTEKMRIIFGLGID
jgi:hypothetical protein